MLRDTIIGSAILLTVASLSVVFHLLPHDAGSGVSRSRDLGLGSRVFSYPEPELLMNGPMDINKATTEELEAIPHIGPSLAKKIMEFRAEKGRIADIDELLDIKGIGTRLLSTIRPYLKVEK